MKKIAILIFLIVAIQSVYSQKVDWSKPIYKVPCCMNDTITYTYSGDTTFVVQAKWSLENIKTYVNGQLIAGNNGCRSCDVYEIIDSCTKYEYEGDTTIAKEYIKRVLEEKIYIDGKITKKRHFALYNSYSSQSIYRYDSLGSLCTRINIEYIEKKIKSVDTIQYTNKYDSQNRLVRIIGSDKTKIAIKYRKNRIKKISHTPKNRYRKISYYKDANYKNDTLIITHTREGNQFERIEYDSINRPVYMEISKGGPIDGYTTSATYKYDDNIQTSEWFEIDCVWTEYVIYKKEE